MAGIEAKITSLIGKPFAWGGRGPDLYDCWGVVAEMSAFVGRPVPTYDDVDSERSVIRAMRAEVNRTEWERVYNPKDWDVLLLSTQPGVFHHAGIITPHGILHAIPRMGVILSRLSDLIQIGYVHQKAYRWVG